MTKKEAEGVIRDTLVWVLFTFFIVLIPTVACFTETWSKPEHACSLIKGDFEVFNGACQEIYVKETEKGSIVSVKGSNGKILMEVLTSEEVTYTIE